VTLKNGAKYLFRTNKIRVSLQVDDEDIARLLTAQRSQSAQGQGVRRLGVLMDLVARRAFASSGDTKARGDANSKNAAARLELLKSAREGGVRLLLDALSGAIASSQDSRCADAIEAIVRTASSIDLNSSPSSDAASGGRASVAARSRSRSASSSQRFTISAVHAVSLVALTPSQLREAVSLFVEALRTGAASSTKTRVIALNAMVALAAHAPADKCLALAIASSALPSFEQDDDDSDQEGVKVTDRLVLSRWI